MIEDPRNFSLFSDSDYYLFNEGTHRRIYEKLGAHPVQSSGLNGVNFAVWAPNARYISVIGSFNSWEAGQHPLNYRGASGLWEGFIPEAKPGDLYKFRIESHNMGYTIDKADPYARYAEVRPNTASIIYESTYEWGDADWMHHRGGTQGPMSPISIYEMHLLSWKRVVQENNRLISYRELAEPLIAYIKKMGFTHVELMPIMEHPYDPSWGYQITGFFAPTSRYGTPDDFRYLVDQLHRSRIGVILDWVPSHYPADGHGLSYFDGSHLYEHDDPRQGFHPDWKSFIFNYGRHEVRSFLISNAIHWLREFHADGLRVDAVASMLYLDYSREDGEWIPNEYGGNENSEAIHFLRQLNTAVREEYPDALMIAEESTAWPKVSHPTGEGGLGFAMKWDMGWMHDTLEYMKREPIYRKHHHEDLTFRSVYAFSENYILSLSHDEVVHGKRSLLERMPGDEFQKFANLRLLYAYMFSSPGKKLLFMGNEYAQRYEWYYAESLDWHLLEQGPHAAMQRFVANLNAIYRNESALHTTDFIPDGFRWNDTKDYEKNVYSYLRHNETGSECILCMLNFTPPVYEHYRVGVPYEGEWTEILCSDWNEYGGSGIRNKGVSTVRHPSHGHDHSIELTLPPLGAIFLKYSGKIPESALVQASRSLSD
jgi:1,4-alpha-glucan branching enzyme